MAQPIDCIILIWLWWYFYGAVLAGLNLPGQFLLPKRSTILFGENKYPRLKMASSFAHFGDNSVNEWARRTERMKNGEFSTRLSTFRVQVQSILLWLRMHVSAVQYSTVQYVSEESLASEQRVRLAEATARKKREDNPLQGPPQPLF